MNSTTSVSSLSIPLIYGYGLGILRVSSDQEALTEALTTKIQSTKKKSDWYYNICAERCWTHTVPYHSQNQDFSFNYLGN